VEGGLSKGWTLEKSSENAARDMLKEGDKKKVTLSKEKKVQTG